MSEFLGSCHCAAIGYCYATAITPADWSIRACQCSFCRAHDASSTSDAGGHITFRIFDEACLQRYRFGLRTADFLLCRQCGVYIGAIIEISGSGYGIINTHALVAPADNIAAPTPIDYESEDIDGRVLRREQRWTPAHIEAADR